MWTVEYLDFLNTLSQSVFTSQPQNKIIPTNGLVPVGHNVFTSKQTLALAESASAMLALDPNTILQLGTVITATYQVREY